MRNHLHNLIVFNDFNPVDRVAADHVQRQFRFRVRFDDIAHQLAVDLHPDLDPILRYAVGMALLHRIPDRFLRVVLS